MSIDLHGNIAREGIGAANCEHNDYFSELLTYRV